MRISVRNILLYTLSVIFLLISCSDDSSVNRTGSIGLDTFVPPELSIIKWPFTEVEGWVITRGHGEATHNGSDYFAIDYSLPIESECFGQPFRAPFSGKVIYSTVTEVPNHLLTGYGNQVIIQSDKDSTFALRAAHFEILEAFKGEYVNEGDLIGKIGSTGNSTGCHVHVVLYRNIYGYIYEGPANESLKAVEILETGGGLYRSSESSPKEAFASPFKFVKEDSVQLNKNLFQGL